MQTNQFQIPIRAVKRPESEKQEKTLARQVENPYICSALHFVQDTVPANPVGNFFIQNRPITAVPTPVMSVNAPSACARCNATGKRGRFYFPAMLNNLKRYTMQTHQLISTPLQAEKGVKFLPGILTSENIGIATGIVAVLALLFYLASGTHALLAGALVMLWAVLACVDMTASIAKGGEK